MNKNILINKNEIIAIIKKMKYNLELLDIEEEDIISIRYYINDKLYDLFEVKLAYNFEEIHDDLIQELKMTLIDAILNYEKNYYVEKSNYSVSFGQDFERRRLFVLTFHFYVDLKGDE